MPRPPFMDGFWWTPLAKLKQQTGAPKNGQKCWCFFAFNRKTQQQKRIYESFEPLGLGKLSAKSHLEPAMLPGVRGTCSWANAHRSKIHQMQQVIEFPEFPEIWKQIAGSWKTKLDLFWRTCLEDSWLENAPKPKPFRRMEIWMKLDQSTSNAPLFLSAANTVIAPHMKAAGMSILQALRMAIPLWIAITAARDFLQLTGGWDSTHLSASISLQEILNISKACLLGQHNLWRHKHPACQSLWYLARCMTMYAYYMFDTCSLPKLSPSQLFRGITRSRAPAAEAVPELQPRIFTKHFPHACTLHKDPQQETPNFHKPLPPPALQQLMPELPGRCGTWSPGEKKSTNEYPVFLVAPTGVFHQHRQGHSLLPSSSTSRIEATWRFNLSMVKGWCPKTLF